MAGLDIVRVAYKGSSTVQLADLLSGQVQISFQNWDVEQHVKAGKLRVLAVTSREPSAMFPGVPTMAATLPGYESITMAGVLAPAKSPDALIKRLNQEIVRVLNQPDIRKKLVDSGVTIVGNTPEEFGATIKSEIYKWGKVIKEAGIKGE
jgi:tripartite-type tricarboxylate transporter receptor subunit TctC